MSIRGRRVLEVVTEYPELIPVARASLKFQCEPMGDGGQKCCTGLSCRLELAG